MQAIGQGNKENSSFKSSKRSFGTDLTKQFANQSIQSSPIKPSLQQHSQTENIELKRENEQLKKELQEEKRKNEQFAAKVLLKEKGPIIRSLQQKSIQLNEYKDQIEFLNHQLQTLEENQSLQAEQQMTNYLLRTRPNVLRQLMKSKLENSPLFSNNDENSSSSHFTF
eukprot:TRINITY_DN2992_c0_g1_i1.p1 TRINITY_DN2992_c0_g1~~TRINITY_DN2992_c0_g1_i1.p1  ORF type:complete len:168 (-),score=67.13 TRINITY_DN2992_c0_g1_i1:62-565(-)